MFADGSSDPVVIISSITTGIVAIVTAIFAGLGLLKSKQVHNEVKTMNELTLGQLGEAQETRRILDKPADERTTRESRHTDASQERSTGA
jgi:hypothetical protein